MPTDGEQWVFTYDRKFRKAELRGGDAGWNTALPVKNGTVEGATIGQIEQLWLLASRNMDVIVRRTPSVH